MRLHGFFALLLLAAFATAVSAQVVGSLTTTFASNNGSNGNFFDATMGAAPVTITSIDVNIDANTNVSLYYKTGTYVGSETVAGNWTLHETVATTTAGTDQPSPVVFTNPLVLSAGTLYGLYVTTDSQVINYTNLTGTVVVSNADLSLSLGAGMNGTAHFGGSLIANREWNGTIHYTIPTPGGQEINVRDPNFNTVLSGGNYTHPVPLVGGTAGPTINFTIENIGAAPLTISGTAITGTPVGCAPTITTSPTSPVAASSSTTLGVDVNPSAGFGAWSFQVTITNNDADEGSYVLNIQGTRGMTGTFDAANGNPGAAFDYGDIGAFFDALEANGLCGPVTLELYDNGGNFTSAANYALSAPAGLSPTNSLTITRATGENPVVSGSGAADPFSLGGTGTIAFWDMGYTTLNGIEFTAGQDWGVGFITSGASRSNISVTSCLVHNINGIGIWIYDDSDVTPDSDVLIENNVVYDYAGTPAFLSSFGAFYGPGGIGLRAAGSNWLIRHNTVIGNRAGAGGCVSHGYTSGGVALADVSFNILIASGVGQTVYNMAQNLAPTGANFNVLFLTGAATVFQSDLFAAGPTAVDLAAWQTATALDANSSGTDPFLTGIALGSEDYHLTASSANAIDAAAGSTTAVDREGDARPFGSANDIGADESSFAAAIPEMDVLRGATPVADGGTDTVGILLAGTNLTYTIENNGSGNLNLTGTPAVVVTPGTNIATLNVTTAPTTPVAASSSTSFVINVVPTAAGAYDFTVSIANNDANENPYNFTVGGNAISNIPPAVAAGTGNWVDAGGGLFTLTVNPGAAINDTLTATDATPDNMTVDVVTSPTFTTLTAQPADITTPTAGPISLTWTGTANATNAPGNYDWAIDISDGTSTTSIIARIILVDVAPQHSAATGIAGNGSLGTPYLATYAQNDPATLSTNLANVTDGNTGQTLNLTGVTQTSGPSTGSGFTFSLLAGVLSVAPSATLTANDVGTQVYGMDIDDGTNTVTLYVSILVLGNSGAITISNASPLPAGTVGAVYATVTLTATGGTGPYTYSVISGSLPAGLSLSAAGDITGTPTAAVTANFTVRAVDSLNDTGSKVFSLTINAAGGSSGGGGGGGGGGGCSADSGSNLAWLALLGLLGLAALAIRTRKA